MRTIRSSDIGAFLFCKRAWWYRKRGVEPSNIEDLLSGTVLHQRHGKVVLISGLKRLLAYILLLASVVLFAIHITSMIMN